MARKKYPKHKNSFRLDERKNPWEHQKGESTRHYYNFCLYRDYGVERSLFKVFGKNTEGVKDSEIEGKKFNKIKVKASEIVSSRCKWVERVIAYDKYIEKQARFDNEKSIKALRKKKIKIGSAMSSFGSVAFSRIFKSLNDQKKLDLKSLGNLTNAEIRKYITEGIELEEQALGVESEEEVEDTEIVTPIIDDDDDYIAFQDYKKLNG